MSADTIEAEVAADIERTKEISESYRKGKIFNRLASVLCYFKGHDWSGLTEIEGRSLQHCKRCNTVSVGGPAVSFKSN